MHAVCRDMPPSRVACELQHQALRRGDEMAIRLGPAEAGAALRRLDGDQRLGRQARDRQPDGLDRPGQGRNVDGRRFEAGERRGQGEPLWPTVATYIVERGRAEGLR